MSEDQGQVIALLCGTDGAIIEIIRDDLQITDQLDPRHSFRSVMDELNAHKFKEFLTELQNQQAVFNWEVNLNTGHGNQLFYFNGGMFEERALVVGSTYHTNFSFFYDELMKINNQQMVSLRETIKKLSQEMVFKMEQELKNYDEFSALNNELVSLQRKLAKTNMELKLAKENAEQANRTKSIFLATMSHEIRTPMNGIIASAELLTYSPLNESQQQTVSVILDSGQLLLSIINDILDLSKIEAGEMKLEEQIFHLHTMINNVTELLQTRAKEQGDRLTFYLDPQIHEYLVGDANRLSQILINFVGNAIKFTSDGQIDIRFFLLADTGTRQNIRFEVKDTGIGIDEESCKKLFQPFFQVDQSFATKNSSTGLGLSISKRLVEMMNGTIGVISEKGSGSTFWVEVELDKAKTEGREEVREVSGNVQQLKRKDLSTRILLAEDNAVNQRISMLQLQQLGFTNITLATNGEEAILQWQEHRPGLILMDNQMPERNGFEATQMIRELERVEPGNVRVPIISITANAMKGDRERALEAGMDDYLTKPVQLSKLKEILNRWLPDQELSAEDRLQEEMNELLHRPTIKEIVAQPWTEDDRDILKQLISMYELETPSKLGDLKRHILEAEYEKAEQLAHHIKSSSVSIGMSALAEVLADIERLASLRQESGYEEPLQRLESLFSQSCQAFYRMIEE
ncbi:ATP-binding protein [Paenibacillus daejeonensis]|uniref:ATP-binding protein n=1 Tax=Paenibacillus daejeonensis TaxID=135193 RepID=UPI000377DCF5|nr:ATP-binding protein [Paenibacillus daejeonensis]